MHSIQNNVVNIKKEKQAVCLLNPNSNFFKYHNSIQEKKARLTISGLEHQLLDAIIRQTIGYKTKNGINARMKKQADYLQQINKEATRNNSKALSRAFKTLFKRNVIIQTSKQPFDFEINLNVSDWVE